MPDVAGIPEAEILHAREVLALGRIVEAYRRRHPSEWYQPHSLCTRGPRAGRPSGQDRFHAATHDIRFIGTGNGWGGSSAMAIEIDAWCRHTNRWQRTPSGPITAIWFAASEAQWSIIGPKLEAECWGTSVRWSAKQNAYVWPDGSRLHIGLHGPHANWRAWEGIEPHLVAFDEPPNRSLWDAMMARKRGRANCKYIGKGTQVDGWTWMATDLYQPWRQHHLDRGIADEEAMMEAQLHPLLWLWVRGGVHDNPAVTDEQVKFHEERRYPSAKMRKVRLFGGFESFAGDMVFDEAALTWYEGQLERLAERFGPERMGHLAAVIEEPPRPAKTGTPRP